MRRRQFLATLGAAAVLRPIDARAQQHQAIRRVGVLTGGAGPDSNARVGVFQLALAQLGWIEGDNLHFEIRQGGGSNDTIRKHAGELAALAPDVIMTIGGTATGFLLLAT